MDVLCYAYLRWIEDQCHPEPLISTVSPGTRIFYIEPPVWHEDVDEWSLSYTQEGTWVVVPKLNQNNLHETIYRQKQLLTHLFSQCGIHDPVLWQYTPEGLFAESDIHSPASGQTNVSTSAGPTETAEMQFGNSIASTYLHTGTDVINGFNKKRDIGTHSLKLEFDGYFIHQHFTNLIPKEVPPVKASFINWTNLNQTIHRLLSLLP